MSSFFALLFKVLLLLPTVLPALELMSHGEYKGEIEPPFEKIYVEQSDLCTFCNGTYYYDPSGEPHKINALLYDEQGMYILLIKYQCPLCGLCYNEKNPGGECGCPILKRRYGKYVWD